MPLPFEGMFRQWGMPAPFKPGESLPAYDGNAWLAGAVARHIYLKMTIRYTHIGIEDQAKAVSNLPALHGRCTSDALAYHSVSSDGTADGSENETPPIKSRGASLRVTPWLGAT